MENEEKVDPELPSGGGNEARQADPEPADGSEDDTMAFQQPESAAPEEAAEPEAVDPELPSGGG